MNVWKVGEKGRKVNFWKGPLFKKDDMRLRNCNYKYPLKGWANTRELIEAVEKRMVSNEELGFGRHCRINDEGCLQIRGTHLRRLLKKRLNWKQVGRDIVDVGNNNGK